MTVVHITPKCPKCTGDIVLEHGYTTEEGSYEEFHCRQCAVEVAPVLDALEAVLKWELVPLRSPKGQVHARRSSAWHKTHF